MQKSVSVRNSNKFCSLGCPTEKVEVCKSNPLRCFFSRSTLGKIETTLQIGETLEKVRAYAILNHTHKYKYDYVTKPMRVVE